MPNWEVDDDNFGVKQTQKQVKSEKKKRKRKQEKDSKVVSNKRA
jgi:hypothetical protein